MADMVIWTAVAAFLLFHLWLRTVTKSRDGPLGVGSSLAQEPGITLLTFPKEGNRLFSMKRTCVASTYPRRYQGSGQIPKKVYEGDSKSITVDLTRTDVMLVTTVSATLMRRGQGLWKTGDGTSIALLVDQPAFGGELEFELIAAGFKVQGDCRQRQPLDSDNLFFQWNCYFERSGSHSFILVARLADAARVVDIGRIEHEVRVVKLDHMTQRQVWILASLAGIASGALGIAQILHGLGVW